MSKAFEKFLLEAQQTTNKPKQKKAKTQGEARKAREAQVASNILNRVTRNKENLALKWEKAEQILSREHIRAHIVKETCTICRKTKSRFSRGEVWAKQLMRTGEHFDLMVAECQHLGAFQFNGSLPITIIESTKHVAFCAKCLKKEAKLRELQRKDNK